VFKNASLIIANSEYTKKLSSYYGNDYNVKVIHPGVTFKESVKIDDYVDITKEGKSLILLSVGRLVKRKGIDNTIKSLKYLVKKYPNIKYIIAGKGNYEKELRKIIEENQLQDYVVLKGEVSEEEKNKLYEMCDLFLMPSYEIEKDGDVEGFGIVYLEANRHGKFVIAGNSGGISDAVINNKTGFIVDGTNPQEIAKAVDRFFTEVYGKKDYKRDCINWALEHDWNIIIDKLMEYIF
jgi:phosphatidylinositol alpha-1,6-mannosyltransferase